MKHFTGEYRLIHRKDCWHNQIVASCIDVEIQVIFVQFNSCPSPYRRKIVSHYFLDALIGGLFRQVLLQLLVAGGCYPMQAYCNVLLKRVSCLLFDNSLKEDALDDRVKEITQKFLTNWTCQDVHDAYSSLHALSDHAQMICFIRYVLPILRQFLLRPYLIQDENRL